MAKKKKDLSKKETAVPVRRKKEPFKKVTELGIGGIVDSVKDEFFNRFPEVMKLTSEPRININESDKEFIIFAAVAGMDKEDLDVEINEDSLRISGEQRKDDTLSSDNWLKMERQYGGFSRAFMLPSPIEPEKASARCERGELIVELPKKSVPTRKKIDITGE